jgi:glycosyltransferase involved in cell wall biosynthesis
VYRLEEFLLINKNIAITSNEAWGDIWYSKHNYAYELSRRNKVVFINPQGKWKISYLLGCKITTFKYNENLMVLNYNNVLPIRSKLLYQINNYLVSSKLRKYFRQHNFSDFILWAFDPNRLSNPKLLGATRSFFHSVDLYSFKLYGEFELAQKSDAIFSIANELIKYYKEFKTPIVLIPHGISSDEFSVEKEAIPEDLTFENYGLYVGNIDKRVDFKLVEEILKEFPETTFLFIGNLNPREMDDAATRIFIEKRYPNLYHKNAIHFKKLKAYVSKAKFCLAPMEHTMYHNTISHHKLLQYLAFGKPIFASKFLEYQNESDLLYMTNDYNETINNIRRFVAEGESDEIVNKRIQYARRFTFQEIFKRVEKFMNKKD